MCILFRRLEQRNMHGRGVADSRMRGSYMYYFSSSSNEYMFGQLQEASLPSVALGMESGIITSSQLTVSTSHNGKPCVQLARSD